MVPNLLNGLKGCWNGSCRTWLEDGVLSDESPIRGEFHDVMGGLWFRHHYLSSLGGKKREGEELIAFNSISNEYQIAWIDDFHMADGILFSSGVSKANGFSVVGSYAAAGSYEVGDGKASWGWRTTYQLELDQSLTIISWNIEPSGAEVKAIEVVYSRSDLLQK